jgi:hypothetical protein
VAIYGRDSSAPRATLRFTLAEAPNGDMVLTLNGLGDESGAPFPFRIEVNGTPFQRMAESFSNWDPAQHGAQGENAPWSQMVIAIPPDVFQAGENEIAVVSLQPGATVGGAPYLLLGEATLAPARGDEPAAAGNASSFRTDAGRSGDGGSQRDNSPDRSDSRGKPDKNNKGSSNKNDDGDGD